MTTRPLPPPALTTTASPAARSWPTTGPQPATAAGGRRRNGGSRTPARSLGTMVLSVVPLLAVLLLWELLTANKVVAWLSFDKLPGPAEVFSTFASQLTTGSYYQDLLSSVRRILLGFGLATVAGVLIGMAVGRSRIAHAALRPLIEVARPIPAIALVPLAILVFPTGEQGIVFITFFAAFFPVVVSTIHAMKSLPTVWEEAALTMGASRLSVLTHIVLPGAMPGIFSGLSVSMGVAWICVISAEMISGQFGIGYYTWQAYGLLDYAGVVVGMLSIGALGFGTAWLVERLGHRVNRWLPRAAK